MASRFDISRRTFLRTAGTAMALPMLEAMIPSIARAQRQGIPPPRRILAYYIPCGIHMQAWTPAQAGADYTLSPILASLAPVKDDVLLLTGLANLPARPDGPGDHAAGTASFLTATHVFKTEGENIRNGISMDQIAAETFKSWTRFPSLELGAEGGGSTGNCDSGYSCAYARNIAWAGPATPLAKEVNPQALFDRLFAGQDPRSTRAEVEKRKLYQTSILDYVLDDARRLKTRLGRTDQHKIDEYLESVSEVETRVRSIAAPMGCEPGPRPGGASDIRDKVKAMSDLIVLALQCDVTRVVTYMLGNAGSNRVYDFLGIREGHHQLSHHMSNPENFRKLQIIDTWEVEQFAYLLTKMKSVVEPTGGTLLDNSLVFFSSEIEDGNAHRHTNLPVIVAGKAGGAIRPGRHIVYPTMPAPVPLANLFLTMLQASGVRATEFANSTGTLSELG